MENIDLLLKYGALLLFSGASFAYLAGLPVRENNVHLRRFGHVTFGLGLGLLAWGCFRDYDGRVWAGSAGLLLTLFVGICGLVAMFRLKIYSSGAFFAPFCTLLLFIQHFFDQKTSAIESSHSLQNILAGFHVLLAVLGEALIIVACALSAAYLRRRRQLRKKDFAEIRTSRFSLEHIESIFGHILWASFIFISLSLISGALYTQLYLQEMTFPLVLKIFWGLLVWLSTLSMILLDKLLKWPFRKIAYISFGSFFLLALFFFGLFFSRTAGGF